ncbi:hypothetical protein AAFF_G00434150 [Aldrovandia affinis]|uniref:Uncharacterized protein n=1 Tax=Aldrovandia affinis TaxID=143900 RepID=A0AAD7S826_9TELE|nr:hypothetical protein AAFF_G00434150 [Aldrovandia affinis]
MTSVSQHAEVKVASLIFKGETLLPPARHCARFLSSVAETDPPEHPTADPVASVCFSVPLLMKLRRPRPLADKWRRAVAILNNASTRGEGADGTSSNQQTTNIAAKTENLADFK